MLRARQRIREKERGEGSGEQKQRAARRETFIFSNNISRETKATQEKIKSVYYITSTKII